jgi:type IV fimbrial biogenesis protein FimT
MEGRRDGFSLSELMIAVAILGILIIIGIPGYKNMQANNRLKESAIRVQSFLNETKAESVRRSAAITVSNYGSSSTFVNATELIASNTSIAYSRRLPLSEGTTVAEVTPRALSRIIFQPNGVIAGVPDRLSVVLDSTNTKIMYRISMTKIGAYTRGAGSAGGSDGGGKEKTIVDL